MIWFLLPIVLWMTHPNLFSAGVEQGAIQVFPSFQARRESWNTPHTQYDIQLTNSVDLVYETLFQNLSFLDDVGLGEFKKQVYDQSLLLRRLYLFLGLGGVEYRGVDGTVGAWPFPLASILTQGQRILIVLENISFKDFLDFLTKENTGLFYRRPYSSHGVRINKEKGTVEEVKIKSPFRVIKETEVILGLDFPFGGVGTKLPDGSCVGPQGWELKGGRLKKKKQLGHLHLYSNCFPLINKTAVLVGLEGCAPNTSNQLGCAHNLMSGIRNQTLNRSVSGGLKWMQLPSPIAPPTEYAGKVLHVPREKFFEIVRKVDEIIVQEDQLQKELFRKILPEDGFTVSGILWTYPER